MAFNPQTLGIIADSIGGGLVRILSLDAGADSEETLLSDGYLADAAEHGIRVDDLVLVRFAEGGALDLFRVESVVADQGTLSPIVAANIQNRRWIDVLDYTPSSEAADCRAGVQAALDVAEGREVVFTVPTGESTRRYNVPTRPASPVWTLPANSGGTVIFEEGAYVDCSDWSNVTGPGATVFSASGSASTAYPLTIDAFKDAESITSPTLAAALNALPRGGRDTWVIIGSDEVFTRDDGAANKSENVVVSYVDGDKVYLSGFLRDTYYVVPYNASAYIVTPCEWQFENLSINGPGPFTTAISGDKGLVVTYGRGCNVRGAKINRLDFVGLQFTTVLGGVMSDLDIRGSTRTVNNGKPSLGLALYDGCQGIIIRDSNVWGYSQQYVLSGSSVLGTTRDILFQGCNGYGAYNGTFTQHAAHEHITYDNCRAIGTDGGFDIRCRHTTVRDCVISGLPEGVNQNLRVGFLLRGRGYQNLTIDNCLIDSAFRVSNIFTSTGFEGRPYNVTFTNNRIIAPANNGMLFEWPYDSMPIFGFRAEDNTVEGIYNSVTPYALNGPWASPIFDGNIARGGIGTGRSILLSSTHTCLGHGPSVASFADNRWERYTEPLVSNRAPLHTSNICLSQALGGAGAVLMNGPLVRGAAAISPRAAVKVTSVAGDNTGITFTIGGITENSTGLDGGYFGATVTGPGAGLSATFKYDNGTDMEFTRVFFVSHDDSVTGDVKVGTVADDDLICVAQSGSSAKELIIDGVGRYPQAIFGGPQTIIITCAGNETARYLWLYGTGEDGGFQDEKITGVSVSTVSSRKRYRSVHSLTVSTATVGNVKLGTASDDDCICASQSIAATATLNGILSVGQTAIFDRERRITYTSFTGDNAGVTFTVVGTDENGAVASEAMAGATSVGTDVTVYGAVKFKTVASVTSDGASTGNIGIGTTLQRFGVFDNNHKMGSSGIKTIYPGDTPYAALLDDDTIFADTTEGVIEITLPAIAFYPNKKYVIKNVGSGGNALTITPNSPETTTDDTLADGESILIQSDGASIWERVAA